MTTLAASKNVAAQFCPDDEEKPLSDRHGRFAWYELLTTDMVAAKSFYGRVVGWEAKNEAASFPYAVFSTGGTEIGGLMELPPDARRMGAMPRWVGYVDLSAWADQCLCRRPTAISAAFRSSPTLRRQLLAW